MNPSHIYRNSNLKIDEYESSTERESSILAHGCERLDWSWDHPDVDFNARTLAEGAWIMGTTYSWLLRGGCCHFISLYLGLLVAHLK